jgi:hypothetical protein
MLTGHLPLCVWRLPVPGNEYPVEDSDPADVTNLRTVKGHSFLEFT